MVAYYESGRSERGPHTGKRWFAHWSNLVWRMDLAAITIALWACVLIGYFIYWPQMVFSWNHSRISWALGAEWYTILFCNSKLTRFFFFFFVFHHLMGRFFFPLTMSMATVTRSIQMAMDVSHFSSFFHAFILFEESNFRKYAIGCGFIWCPVIGWALYRAKIDLRIIKMWYFCDLENEL